MEYKIVGEPLPVAICKLANGEKIVCESGAMSWMTGNMKMETTSGGGVGKVFGRMLTGENLFQNTYTATDGDGEIAFAAKMPGSIRAYEVSPNRPIIVQKGGFLAASSGVEVSVHFKKKVSASLFGGEGFIMQKLSGSGTALIEIDGYAVDYQLSPGEKMVIDTGYLAMMDESCTMEIEAVAGLKNMFLGGEGVFNTVITGPGTVTLQTLPIPALAGAIIPFIPTNSK